MGPNFFSRGGPKFLIWLGSNFLRWWVGPKYLRQVGPNKFYGNISFIDWRAALFGNKGLWGRRRRGQSFTILQACVVCVNGHNVLQCKGSRWVTQWVTVLHVHSSHKYTSTHTTWVRMGLTMVRGKREREGFWTNALFLVAPDVQPRRYLFSLACCLYYLCCCRETIAGRDMYGCCWQNPEFLSARGSWGPKQN